MRNVVVVSTISVDGFVAPAPGAPDHRSAPEDPARSVRSSTGSVMPARTRWDGSPTRRWPRHWPRSTDDYAAPMNALPKVVLLEDAGPRGVGQLPRGTRRSRRRDLQARQEPGGDILAWGGAAFVQALSRAGLVDEYRLTVNPVALGDGLPLFKGLAAPIALQLVEATTYGTGAALHIYRAGVGWRAGRRPFAVLGWVRSPFTSAGPLEVRSNGTNCSPCTRPLSITFVARANLEAGVSYGRTTSSTGPVLGDRLRHQRGPHTDRYVPNSATSTARWPGCSASV